MTQKWTGKSLGNSFFQNIQILFIKLGGRYLAYFLLYFIVAFYTLLPNVRKSASYYLKKRFVNDSKIKRFFRTYKLNLTFGKILTDRALFGIKGDINIVSSKQDQQLCKDLLAKNKGLIIITAHCGCWQMAMPAFDFMDGDKYVVYYRSKEDIDKHAHELSGKKSPVNFINPLSFGGGSFEIMAALEKKGIVCVMGDRTFGSKENSITVDFLGSKVEIPFSVYRIAGALGVPIAIIFFPYKGKGKVDSFIADSFFVEDKGSNSQSYQAQANKFINSLEKFTKQYPYQLFNYYDMWEEK